MSPELEERPCAVLTQTILESPVVKWAFCARVWRSEREDVVLVKDHTIELKLVVGGELEEADGVLIDFAGKIVAAKVAGNFEHSSDANQVPPQYLVVILQQYDVTSVCYLYVRPSEEGRPCWLYKSQSLVMEDCPREIIQDHTLLLAAEPRGRAVAIATNFGLIKIQVTKPVGDFDAGDEDTYGTIDCSEISLLQSFDLVSQEAELQIGGEVLRVEFVQHPERGDAVLMLVTYTSKAGIITSCLKWEHSSGVNDVTTIWRQAHPQHQGPPQLIIPLHTSPGALFVYGNDFIVYKNFEVADAAVLHCQADASYEKDGTSTSESDQDELTVEELHWTAWAESPRITAATYGEADVWFMVRSDGLVRQFELHQGYTYVIGTDIGRSGVPGAMAFGLLDSTGRTVPPAISSLTDDHFLIFGNDGSGGLFRSEKTDGKEHGAPDSQRQLLSCVQQSPKWTPLHDFEIELHGSNSKQAPWSSSSVGRLFTCSGSSPQDGNIAEIKVGLQASHIRLLPTEALWLPWAEQIWVLPGLPGFSKEKHAIIVLTTDRLTQFYFVDEHEVWIPDEISLRGLPSLEPFDLDSRTLFASIMASGSTVQVTENDIKASRFTEDGSKTIWPSFSSQFHNINFYRATICYETNEILTAQRDPDGTHMVLLIEVLENELGCGFSCHRLVWDEPQCEVTCLFLSGAFAIIGTSSGKLHIYNAQQASKNLPSRFHIYGSDSSRADPEPNECHVHEFGESGAVCHSICAIAPPSHSLHGLILAGLRNGKLAVLSPKVFNGTEMAENFVCGFDIAEIVELDTAQVSVIPDYMATEMGSSVPQSAILSSSNFFGRITYNPRRVLDRIWITPHDNLQNSKQKEQFTSAMSSLVSIPPWLCVPERFKDALIGTNAKEAYLFTLCKSPGPVPITRNIRVSGMPHRMLLSKYLPNKLLVYMTYYHVGEKESLESSSEIYSYPFPVLRAFDTDFKEEKPFWAPEEPISDADTTNPSTGFHLGPDSLVLGNSCERVLDMVEWPLRIGDHRWALLVISTARYRRDEDESGRLLILGISTVPQKKPWHQSVKFTKVKEIKKSKPITCVAPIADNYLIYCFEDRMEIDWAVESSKSSSSIRWEKVAATFTSFNATRIEIVESLIFLFSTDSTIQVYFFDGRKVHKLLDCKKPFQSFGNIIAREEGLFLGTDRTGRFVGLQIPKNEIEAEEMKIKDDSSYLLTRFDIQLPSPITRLRRNHKDTEEHSDDPHKCRGFLASTIDGAIYSLRPLRRPEYQLLFFIQSLVLLSKRMAPAGYFAQRGSLSWQNPPSFRDQRVDGDIVRRLCERDEAWAKLRLKELLLEQHPCEEQRAFDNPKTRWTRLIILAQNALGDGTEGSVLSAVTEFLFQVLGQYTNPGSRQKVFVNALEQEAKVDRSEM